VWESNKQNHACDGIDKSVLQNILAFLNWNWKTTVLNWSTTHRPVDRPPTHRPVGISTVLGESTICRRLFEHYTFSVDCCIDSNVAIDSGNPVISWVFCPVKTATDFPVQSSNWQSKVHHLSGSFVQSKLWRTSPSEVKTGSESPAFRGKLWRTPPFFGGKIEIFPRWTVEKVKYFPTDGRKLKNSPPFSREKFQNKPSSWGINW